LFFFIFLFFLCFFNVVFLLLLKHKRTQLQIWCISLGQIAVSPVFDLYHNHGYIITFSTFRSLVFTNGRFLFLIIWGMSYLSTTIYDSQRGWPTSVTPKQPLTGSNGSESQTVTLRTLNKWLPCVACGLVRVRHTPFPGQIECFSVL